MKNRLGSFSLFSKLGKGRFVRSLARLPRDEDGSYLLLMTLVVPVLIGLGGLAAEASFLFYNHRTLQSAADAAAYSAAISYSNDSNVTNAGTQANAIIQSYGFTLGSGSTVNEANVTVQTPGDATPNTFAGWPAVTVTISRPQSAFFSGYYGFSVFSNGLTNVSATAVIRGLPGSNLPGGGNCVLALGNTATGNNAQNAIQLQGNPTINTPNCGIFSNSTDCSQGSYSESLGGHATINAASFGSAGCMNIFGNARVNLPGSVTCTSSGDAACTQGDGAVSDPLAPTMPSTPSGSCQTASTTVPPGQTSVTLTPGRYCGINANGTNYTLTPGTYILDCSASTCPTAQGTSSMLIVKNATLNETPDASGNTGVTLVFDCSECSASQWPNDGMLVAANGNVSLTAPSTGPTTGYVIMAGTDMPLSPPVVFDTHSNPNVSLTGTVYAPNGSFAWGGNPSTSTTSCLTLIVNLLTLYGDSSFGGTGCDSGGTASGSGGPGLPIGNVVTLVD
jgi:Flp pilus assembly protein TadG